VGEEVETSNIQNQISFASILSSFVDSIWYQSNRKANYVPFYGPYCIKEKINEIAFRLELPKGARLHYMFHVGLPKKFIGSPPDDPPMLPPIQNGVIVPTPQRALKVWLCRGARQTLIQWLHQPPSTASWEDHQFQQCYPDFQLENKLLLEEGRDVMWVNQYVRRNKVSMSETSK
jgi:hypothetical protein